MVSGTSTENEALFISHNAADRPFAVALRNAVHEPLDSDTLIDVRFSTSDEAGPQGGEKWRDWIYRQVVEFGTAPIVVTPNSLGKPWLLWEAGACFGAALAKRASAPSGPSGQLKEPDPRIGQLIVSIAFGLTENECPDPLRGEQIILVTHLERMEQLLLRVLQVRGISDRAIYQAGKRMQAVLERYLATVRHLMLQAPSLVTEANVQDWLSRLDEYVRAERLSELKGFQRWMTLAFGRDADGAGVPIDVRLHRGLGELYLGQTQFALAVEQLTLARRAAPRDIYVLRLLSEASMKHLLSTHADGDPVPGRERIESLLTAIEELDGGAFVSTPDAAALYGKYLLRVVGDPEGARRAYEAALRANPDSYYLADLVAQTLLEHGLAEQAEAVYRQALGIIDRVGEKNVWSQSTAAAAHVALGNLEGARQCLGEIAALPGTLTEATVNTVGGGLRNVASRSVVPSEMIDDLLGALRIPA
jgi:tetratricopeptide (TPR) repeat protein